ncbi:MAG: ComF family protein [Phycisphaerae bacterium]
MPRACAACDAAIDLDEEDLCSACWDELSAAVGGVYCRTCGDDRGPHLLIDGRCAACRLNKPNHRKFAAFVRVGRYAGSLRRLILRFKRQANLERLLGTLLTETIPTAFDPRRVDLWVPVPTHWRRRIVRGFQPTRLLTTRVARQWSARPSTVLSMTRYVPPFHRSMSLTQRAAAIRGAFRASPRQRIKGRTVCVIDDVTTTGATLAEARHALRRAGATQVFAAVVAKTFRETDAAEHAQPDSSPETPGLGVAETVGAPANRPGLDREAGSV